ncbi:plasmid pRiA4b ORF-3 family protein [uncultured Desulfosarcina sp.]|uniref:plasmid pRiA4b ORF-3 family protein n=1 Tax=uncultured Desulfosarcina sp. TaxID=218289 RepID=UPI0029C93376|nr:plasmid pRiA4b ORF-3 family protein [uncultured Desulfosarcina sp.]
MKIYQLKVSIIGIPKLYRVIEISGNCTFDDLHMAIFDAFDRYDPHLYSFFITKADTKNIRSIINSPEITHPQNTIDPMGFDEKKDSASKTRIGSVALAEKDVFHYLFDFGDDWWHRIRVEKIIESESNRKRVKLIKAVGEAPPQYPEDEDYFEDEDE